MFEVEGYFHPLPIFYLWTDFDDFFFLSTPHHVYSPKHIAFFFYDHYDVRYWHFSTSGVSKNHVFSSFWLTAFLIDQRARSDRETLKLYWNLSWIMLEKLAVCSEESVSSGKEALTHCLETFSFRPLCWANVWLLMGLKLWLLRVRCFLFDRNIVMCLSI